MNDNKKFWQRYAKFYAGFMKSSSKGYIEIKTKVEQYLNKNMSVLELACGSGQLTFLLADKVKCWEATDFSENMIREAKAAGEKIGIPDGLSFSVQDATNLPYENECFDAVMIANALHIMPQPEKALSEIKRVLKKDGVLFAPTFVHGEGVGFALRTGLIQAFGFKAYMKPTAMEFAEYIEGMGFEVVESDVIGTKVSPLCCLTANKKG